MELIHERNYPDITVGDITKRGNVGRSTLYRHYQSRADVLVDVHKDMFTQLFSGLSTAGEWLDSEPPAELVSLLERHRRLGKNPFSLSYKLGNDLDYLIDNINRQLTIVIEGRLRDSYTEGDCSIPLPILAQSISASYSGLIISCFTRFQSCEAYRFASYIQRTIAALILGVLR